ALPINPTLSWFPNLPAPIGWEFVREAGRMPTSHPKRVMPPAPERDCVHFPIPSFPDTPKGKEQTERYPSGLSLSLSPGRSKPPHWSGSLSRLPVLPVPKGNRGDRESGTPRALSSFPSHPSHPCPLGSRDGRETGRNSGQFLQVGVGVEVLETPVVAQLAGMPGVAVLGQRPVVQPAGFVLPHPVDQLSGPGAEEGLVQHAFP